MIPNRKVMRSSKISKHVKDLLTHKNSSKRRVAAEELSKADERALYPLIKALRDDDLGVQDAAILSLISIGGEVTAYMVIPLLREDSQLRNAAMLILKEISSDAIPLLKPLLFDKDDDIRKFAIDIICHVGKCDYPELLVEILKNDVNPNVRASAAKAIGVLNYKEAIPDLVIALQDQEWVCFSALEALSLIKDESAVMDIVRLLDSNSLAIRYAVIETLGIIGYKSAKDYLVRHFFKSDPIEKEAIVKSFVLLEDVPNLPGIYQILLELLKKEDLKDKDIALKGLRAINDRKAIPEIIDIAGSIDPLEPDSEDFLHHVKSVLSSFGCSDEFIKLIENPKVRYRGKVLAIDVLGMLRCKNAIPSLINLLKTDIRDIKRASIKAIGETKGPESVSVLIDSIESEDGHIRRSALYALGEIADKSIFDLILDLLKKETYEDVLEEAIRALLKIDRDRYISMKDEFSEHIKRITDKVVLYG